MGLRAGHEEIQVVQKTRPVSYFTSPRLLCAHFTSATAVVMGFAQIYPDSALLHLHHGLLPWDGSAVCCEVAVETTQAWATWEVRGVETQQGVPFLMGDESWQINEAYP